MTLLNILKNPQGKYSLGRVAFAIFFFGFMAVYFYRWVKFGENEIHGSVQTLILILLGYNFGKKLKAVK